ncbi:MAG TPA: hypothetical protein VIM42_06505 [Clostridium sp.]
MIVTIGGNVLSGLVNPFVPNPALSQPEQANFIEKGISKGIENGLGSLGDRFIQASQVKAESFAKNIPEIVTVALISYLIYIGYKSFIKRGSLDADFAKIYTAFMAFIIFKLFWKVVLKI